MEGFSKPDQSTNINRRLPFTGLQKVWRSRPDVSEQDDYCLECKRFLTVSIAKKYEV